MSDYLEKRDKARAEKAARIARMAATGAPSVNGRTTKSKLGRDKTVVEDADGNVVNEHQPTKTETKLMDRLAEQIMGKKDA